MKDELKRIVDALVDAQQQISSMSTDDRMALGEAFATALREAGMLERFELNILRACNWKIDAHSMTLRVSGSPCCDDDIPF